MTPEAPRPDDEAARLECLISLDVLDSGREPMFEQITQLASELCGAPIALVSLVDARRQWFKSNLGLTGVQETPRDVAFCAHAIQADTLMEVADARQDPRFANNPLVIGAPGIRFYAGMPLVMPSGERLGTLCVIDHVARQLNSTQRMALQGLAGLVTSSLLERKNRLALSRELEQTEARYRLIVEGQSDLISLAAADGTLSYVNAAYAQFFGLSQHQMVGRKLLDFVAPADQQAVADHLRRVVEAGHVGGGVNRMVSADGRECWVAWTNRAVAGVDAQGASIHSVGRDITEQRRAEQALADNETRSRLLYEATPAMLHSIDLQGRLLNVSNTWLRCMGYRREEVIGRASADFLTPESARRARELVLPAFFAEGRCEDVEYQMVHKDGSVFDVLLSAVLERDAAGKPVRSLAVLRDVTELHATAASLNTTSHMLQLVLDSLPARVSYWDLGSLNQFANRAFLDWFGVSQASISGKHAREVLGAAAYARVEQPINAGLAGVDGQVELSSPGPDGKLRTTDMRFIPHLREGRVSGLFVFALDITAQRQAERDVVSQRRRQQVATEQALAEKETLLREVYHRVKNNLQVVQSLLNIQRHALPDGPARTAMRDTALRIRAMALVHEKLYQSGNLAAISLPVYTGDLLDLLANAHGIDRTAVQLHAEIAAIETRLDSAIPYGLLVTELVTNSLKHGFPNGRQGQVWVTLQRRDDGDMLTVADNGIGFETAAAEAGKPASMGLQLAASLATQLGGELHTASVAGARTTALLTRL